MSVANYVQKIRNSDEPIKQRAVFLWTVIFALVIFLVWALTFSISLVNNSVDEARLRAEAEVALQNKINASIIASTSMVKIEEEKALTTWLSQIISEGANSVSNGFWLVGGWLHK